jgi:hypothetical protein
MVFHGNDNARNSSISTFTQVKNCSKMAHSYDYTTTFCDNFLLFALKSNLLQIVLHIFTICGKLSMKTAKVVVYTTKCCRRKFVRAEKRLL